MSQEENTPFDFSALEEKLALNQDIWRNNGELLDPEVRKHLIRVALGFYKDLEVTWADIKDIQFTGSLANYNWSRFSDLDLHLIVDFKEVDAKRINLVENYFKAKKSLWNNTHDIKIFGFEIEIYVQDVYAPHFSSGVYSVLNNEWITEPSAPTEKRDINKEEVISKAKDFIKMIDEIGRMSKDDKEEKIRVLKLIDRVQDKIKNMRRCGLEKDGEYSIENLAFKFLRRDGHIEKLHDTEIETFDSLMSLSHN